MKRHNEHHRTTSILLAVFILLAVGNVFIVYNDVIFYLSGFVAAVNSTNSSATASICINHPPNMTDIANQNATADFPFTLQIIATDKDTSQTLAYSDDAPQFVIGPATGLISFTPTQNATQLVTITVSDGTRCLNNNVSKSFTLTITGEIGQNVTENVTDRERNKQHFPSPKEKRTTQPPTKIIIPRKEIVITPEHIIKIIKIVVNGKEIYNYDTKMSLAEVIVKYNSIVNLQITTKNIGSEKLTNVVLFFGIDGSAKLVSLNPQGPRDIDPGAEITYTAQLAVGEDPVDMTLYAVSDQDEDIVPSHIVPSPRLESPSLGIRIPGWIPVIITLPLLFLLGYSIWSNKSMLLQLFQDVIGMLFALFLRRSYFIDEDMLRSLILEKKFNKLLHQYVIDTVYGRYKDVYKNIRTIELKTDTIGLISNIVRVYKVPKELATLIVMTEKRAHPRIMTRLVIADKLREDFKRIKFYNPLEKKEKGTMKTKQIIQ